MSRWVSTKGTEPSGVVHDCPNCGGHVEDVVDEVNPPRVAFFMPTVVLKLNGDNEVVGISWDWADSYRGTTIDLGDSIEEELVDDQACEIMDEFIRDWDGHGGKYAGEEGTK